MALRHCGRSSGRDAQVLRAARVLRVTRAHTHVSRITRRAPTRADAGTCHAAAKPGDQPPQSTICTSYVIGSPTPSMTTWYSPTVVVHPIGSRLVAKVLP